MGLRLLRFAVAYLVVGTLLGLAMGTRQSFAPAPVHAHRLHVGWASRALAGLIVFAANVLVHAKLPGRLAN